MANSVTAVLQNTFVDHSNNVIGQLTPSQLTGKYTGLTLKTPTKSFTFSFKGQHINFLKAAPVMCASDLAAALAAAAAPVV